MALSTAGLRTRILNMVAAAEPRARAYQAAITNAAGTGTTISVPDGDAWQVGDIVETPGGEQALVTAISTNDLTVTRAIGGVSVESLSSGDIVKKNPRFSIEQIDQAVDDILLELDDSIYNLATENISYTSDQFYDVTDTAMVDIVSIWYIQNGYIYTPYFHFMTDPANDQPQVFIGAPGFTGNVHVVYRKPYAAVTDLPNRLGPLVGAGAVYKLLGSAGVVSTEDPGKRTDRTVQGGQEMRDSYWFYREFERLRAKEVANQMQAESRVPKDRQTQRIRRYRK